MVSLWPDQDRDFNHLSKEAAGPVLYLYLLGPWLENWLFGWKRIKDREMGLSFEKNSGAYLVGDPSCSISQF